MGDDPDLTVVLRFLGTSPDSSNIASLLKSVIDQISRSSNDSTTPPQFPQNFNDIKELFHATLNSVTAKFFLILTAVRTLPAYQREIIIRAPNMLSYVNA